MSSIFEPALARACGQREMDALTVSNAWASVTIIRQDAHTFSIAGDLANAGYKYETFTTISAAMAAALASLAVYERGRQD